MTKDKKTNGKFTKFLRLTLITGSCVTTSLKQINTIAESHCLIVLDRYVNYHSDNFMKVAPVVINPKYVVIAERVDGWLTKKEGYKRV